MFQKCPLYVLIYSCLILFMFASRRLSFLQFSLTPQASYTVHCSLLLVLLYHAHPPPLYPIARQFPEEGNCLKVVLLAKRDVVNLYQIIPVYQKSYKLNVFMTLKFMFARRDRIIMKNNTFEVVLSVLLLKRRCKYKSGKEYA